MACNIVSNVASVKSSSSPLDLFFVFESDALLEAHCTEIEFDFGIVGANMHRKHFNRRLLMEQIF